MRSDFSFDRVHFLDEALWSGFIELNLYGGLFRNLWREDRTFSGLFEAHACHYLATRYPSVFSGFPV